MKKIIVTTLSVIVVAAVAVVLTGWYLSARLSGARLARLETSPHFRDGAFVNLEPEASFEVTWAYLEEQLFGKQQRVPPRAIPVVRLPVDYLRGKPAAGLSVTWLGHATSLVEIDGQRLLTDPVLSQRASPFPLLGPERLHPPPVALDALQGIDAVIVSHSHYDHLDQASIRHLAGQGALFLVPLGTGVHLERWGVARSQIHELDWWQQCRVGDLDIVATPARQYSGRGLFDFKATLWASWSIVGPNHRVFFSEDTGYSEEFRKQVNASDRSTSPSSRSAPTDQARRGRTFACRRNKQFRDTSTSVASVCLACTGRRSTWRCTTGTNRLNAPLRQPRHRAYGAHTRNR